MSSETVALKVERLGKCYRIYDRPQDRLKQSLMPRVQKTLSLFGIGRLALPSRAYCREFWAVRDVSFELERGEALGILGRNGSGKSTLLQMICGTVAPTSGAVAAYGRISALLELGAGFNPEFSGRENVFLNASILGFDRKEIERKYDEIAAFADIGEFIEQPVKTYSSGMFVRLAFAVAINVEPDILVVDEALSVGDIHFQQRCFQKIRKIREAGTSIVFVSHDIEMVKRVCDSAIVMHDGKVVYGGHPGAATAFYIALVAADFDVSRVNFSEPGRAQPDREPGGAQAADAPLMGVYRYGDGTASVRSVRVGASPDDPALVGVGDRVRFDIQVEFHQPKDSYIVGLLIKDRTGAEIIALNTYQEKFAVPAAQAGDAFVFSFTLPIDLRPGDYSVSATIAYSQYEMKWMDWVDNALVLRVTDRVADRRIFGLVLPASREVAVRHAQLAHAGAGART